MRKIVSKEQEKKRKQRNQLIVGAVLIFIIIMSTLGYSFRGGTNNETKIVYNGFEFIKQDNFWTYRQGDLQFYFSFNPEETEDIISNVSIKLENYSSKPLYIYSENSDAESEIYRNLDQIAMRRQYACLENSSYCAEGLPVKSCQDNFIIIEESNEEGIEQQGNCIFIKAPREESLIATDRFLFEIIGAQ